MLQQNEKMRKCVIETKSRIIALLCTPFICMFLNLRLIRLKQEANCLIYAKLFMTVLFLMIVYDCGLCFSHCGDFQLMFFRLFAVISFLELN